MSRRSRDKEGPSGWPRSTASAADVSRTSASAIVAVTLQAHRGRSRRPARMPRPLLPAEHLHPVQGSNGSPPPLVRVALKAASILHGDQHRHGAMVALDEEPLARRCLKYQDGPERPSQVEGADRSHSRP